MFTGDTEFIDSRQQIVTTVSCGRFVHEFLRSFHDGIEDFHPIRNIYDALNKFASSADMMMAALAVAYNRGAVSTARH